MDHSNNGHQGERQVRLDEILTGEQLAAVTDIVDKAKDGMEAAKQLKTYLRQFKDELEAKGLDSDYLAYLIVAAAGNK